MEFDDRKMRGDVERGKQLDGGVRRVDARHSDVPAVLGSSRLPAQSPA